MHNDTKNVALTMVGRKLTPNGVMQIFILFVLGLALSSCFRYSTDSIDQYYLDKYKSIALSKDTANPNYRTNLIYGQLIRDSLLRKSNNVNMLDLPKLPSNANVTTETSTCQDFSSDLEEYITKYNNRLSDLKSKVSSNSTWSGICKIGGLVGTAIATCTIVAAPVVAIVGSLVSLFSGTSDYFELNAKTQQYSIALANVENQFDIFTTNWTKHRVTCLDETDVISFRQDFLVVVTKFPGYPTVASTNNP